MLRLTVIPEYALTTELFTAYQNISRSAGRISEYQDTRRSGYQKIKNELVTSDILIY